MSPKHIIIVLLAATFISTTNKSYAIVEIGNIKIMDDGRIVFPDSSEQISATQQGPQGPKGDVGPQGPKGDPGSQVTKEAICQVYADDNLPPPPFCSKKIIFLSSQQFTTNLGGLAGADLKCQNAAESAGLNGIYKAWLSDSNISAKDRLTHSPAPYIRTDGVIVANNWFDLTDGWLKDPILCDEYKQCNFIDEITTVIEVFTSTEITGGTRGASYTSANYCLDWTSDSNIPNYGPGNALSIDKYWTKAVSSGSCKNYPVGRLYCVQQ